MTLRRWRRVSVSDRSHSSAQRRRHYLTEVGCFQLEKCKKELLLIIGVNAGCTGSHGVRQWITQISKSVTISKIDRRILFLFEYPR